MSDSTNTATTVSQVKSYTSVYRLINENPSAQRDEYVITGRVKGVENILIVCKQLEIAQQIFEYFEKIAIEHSNETQGVVCLRDMRTGLLIDAIK